MAYEAKILKDSICNGHRLTTFEVTYPRIIHAELMTHRVFSRNSASSRAIPIEKMMKKVIDDPFIPVYWGKNQKGMQADVELTKEEQLQAKNEWLNARTLVVEQAKRMLALGVHKQITNRLLEPWLYHTVIVTATEWDNFWGLRCHPAAQPEIKKIADMMKSLYDSSLPMNFGSGDWHLPLVDDIDALLAAGYSIDNIVEISVGRCARISYLTHDGKRDPNADIELAGKLRDSGHMSPWEHVARPMTPLELDVTRRYDVVFKDGTIINQVTLPPEIRSWNDVRIGTNLDVEVESVRETFFCGNFDAWIQARKQLPNEDNFLMACKR